MHYSIKKLITSAAVGLALLGVSLPTATRAQAYPIDCAILLCLSGGWPASVPCARARAEFIRRVTPWPVEPPLQIWRCPMHTSYETTPTSNSIFDAYFPANSEMTHQSFPLIEAIELAEPVAAVWRSREARMNSGPTSRALHLAQDRADIDISGPEFNFVRSIRVFDVRYAMQQGSRRDGDCNRTATVILGTYGVQGDFSWHLSSINSLPTAHVGLERWGDHCPKLYHRSVFVDWREYNGSYDFEQINY